MSTSNGPKGSDTTQFQAVCDAKKALLDIDQALGDILSKNPLVGAQHREKITLIGDRVRTALKALDDIERIGTRVQNALYEHIESMIKLRGRV